MRYKTIIGLLSIIILIFAAFLAADSSQTINYQGYLTDSAGDPVTGSFSVTFSIYEDGSAPTPIWSEIHAVDFDNGLFSVVMGQITPFQDTVFNGEDRYLGITIGSDPEISPRTLFTSAPGAAVANKIAGDVATGDGKLILKDLAGASTAIFSSGYSDDIGKIRFIDPGDDEYRIFEIIANRTTDEASMKLIDPGDDEEYVGIYGIPSSGASIKMFNPQPEPPALYFEVNTSNTGGPSMSFFDDAGEVMGIEPSPWNGGFSMKMIDPGDDESRLELITDFAGDETSIKLIAPGDENNPAIELKNNPNGSLFKMQRYDAGSMMYYDGFTMELDGIDEISDFRLIAPGNDDIPGFEMMADGLANTATFRMMDMTNELNSMLLMSGNSSGASIKMFNPQPEPPALLMEIGASYAGVKAGTAAISLYDDNNNLESHLDPGKLSLEASIEGPPIILEVDMVDEEARVGIGNYDPAANLVVGNNLGSFLGTRVIIGDTSPGTESGVVIGEDNDNRAWILWNVDNNTLGMGTKQNGSAFGSTIVLDSGRVGIGTASPSEELHVVGDICYTGSIGACSDVRYKQDINTISEALNRVTGLRGVTFNWRREEFPQNKFSEKEQVGLIAQEVEKVLPQVVSRNYDGYYNVDYSKLTPLLVEAIKELKTENEELRRRIEALENAR